MVLMSNLVEILPCAVLWIHWLPRYTQVLTWNHFSCHGSLHACFSYMSCKAWRKPVAFPISCEHSLWFLWICCPQGQWNKFLGFSIAHLCLSFSSTFLPNFVQCTGHKWSGLHVNCCLVSLSPDHIYPSGGFSSNRVNWVKTVQEADNSHDPSMFQ